MSWQELQWALFLQNNFFEQKAHQIPSERKDHRILVKTIIRLTLI